MRDVGGNTSEAVAPEYARELHGRAKARLVGRAREESVLRRALARAAEGPALVCVIGDAGVGKSALASLLRLEAQATGHRVAWISGESIDANIAGIEAALAERRLAFESLGRAAKPDVLVIDAYEELTDVSSWLFTEALPRAGRRLLTVVTSRRPLQTSVRTDLGVASILEELRLRSFDSETSSALLELHDIPPGHHRTLHAMTQGLPLALTLVAERHRRGDDEELPEVVPSEVVRELAIAFLRETRSVDQRRALYALSLVRCLDQGLLEAIVGGPAQELYDMLRELSFVSESPAGLMPHALVREALHRDHHLRDPAGAQEMATAAAQQILSQVPSDDLNRYRRCLLDALYALREHGRLRELEMQAVATTYMEPVSLDNAPELMRWIRQHEGDESAALLPAALEARAYHGFIVRDAHDGQFEGVSGIIDLTLAPDALIDSDPVLRAAREATQSIRGRIGVFRWFFQRDTYTEVGPQMAPMVFSGPAISWSSENLCDAVVFAPTPPEMWTPVAPPCRMELIGPEFEMGGRRHQCYVRELAPPGATGDRNELLASTTLDMAMLWAGLELMPKDGAQLEADVDVEDVREALALLRRPDLLGQSKLASALGDPAPGDAAAGNASRLTDLLKQAVAELSRRPSLEEFATVLRVTYLEPSVKQRAAAADLGLPYGTYRHRLRRAIELLTLTIRGEL